MSGGRLRRGSLGDRTQESERGGLEEGHWPSSKPHLPMAQTRRELPMALAEQRTHITASRRTSWRVYLARTWPLYAMLVLPMLQLTLFHYYPMYGVIVAFTNL